MYLDLIPLIFCTESLWMPWKFCCVCHGLGSSCAHKIFSYGRCPYAALFKQYLVIVYGTVHAGEFCIVDDACSRVLYRDGA